MVCMHVELWHVLTHSNVHVSSTRDNWLTISHLEGLELYYHCAMGVYWHLIIFQVPRLTRCVVRCDVVWCGVAGCSAVCAPLSVTMSLPRPGTPSLTFLKLTERQ